MYVYTCTSVSHVYCMYCNHTHFQVQKPPLQWEIAIIAELHARLKLSGLLTEVHCVERVCALSLMWFLFTAVFY